MIQTQHNLGMFYVFQNVALCCVSIKLCALNITRRLDESHFSSFHIYLVDWIKHFVTVFLLSEINERKKRSREVSERKSWEKRSGGREDLKGRERVW